MVRIQKLEIHIEEEVELLILLICTCLFAVTFAHEQSNICYEWNGGLLTENLG